MVNESGLWSLVLKSRKPEAKRFKKWLTSEVIPSIRKTGSYTIGQESSPSPPDLMPVIVQILAELKDGHLETKSVVADLGKRIDYLEKVSPPANYMTIVAFAKWKGLRGLTTEDLKRWGGQLKAHCRKEGIETKPIPDDRWGCVNSYPIHIIQGTFDRFGPKL